MVPQRHCATVRRFTDASSSSCTLLANPDLLVQHHASADRWIARSGCSDGGRAGGGATRSGRRIGERSPADGDRRVQRRRELRIGQLSRRGVDAVVNEAPMPVSLLGMSFLRELEGWEAKDGRLMLYW